MRHDKLQEWAEDTANPEDEVNPHQARGEQIQTPAQKRDPQNFDENQQEEEEKFDIDAPDHDPKPVSESEDAPVQFDEFDNKARQMGWVPRDEWRGDPDDWTPAKRFVQTGDMIKANRALHQKVEYLENNFNQRLANMQQSHATQLKTNLDQLKLERDSAVDVGDTEKYQAINKQIETLEQTTRETQIQPQLNAPPLPDPAKPAQQQTYNATEAVQNLVQHPVVKQWRNNNPWVNEDSPKTAYAERQFLQWVNNNVNNPSATIEQGLLFVDDALTREFPDVNTNRQRASLSEKRGGPARRSSNLTLTMNDLNRDERIIWQTMGKSWKNQAAFLKSCQADREK